MSVRYQDARVDGRLGASASYDEIRIADEAWRQAGRLFEPPASPLIQSTVSAHPGCPTRSLGGCTFVDTGFISEGIAPIMGPTLGRREQQPSVVVDVVRAGAREARLAGRKDDVHRGSQLVAQRDHVTRVTECDAAIVDVVIAVPIVIRAVVGEHEPIS